MSAGVSPTLVYIFTGSTVSIQVEARVARAGIRTWQVSTELLAVTIAAFINILALSSHQPVTLGAGAGVTPCCVYTHLCGITLMGPCLTLINVNTGAILSKRVAEDAGGRGTAHYGITRTGTGPGTGADRRRRKLLRKPHRAVRVQWLGVGRRLGSGKRLRIKALGEAEVTSVLIYTPHVTTARTRHRAALVHVDAQPGANVVREPLGAPLRTANNTKQTQSRKRSHTAEITKRVSWVFLFLLHPISVKISD